MTTCHMLKIGSLLLVRVLSSPAAFPPAPYVPRPPWDAGVSEWLLLTVATACIELNLCSDVIMAKSLSGFTFIFCKFLRFVKNNSNFVFFYCSIYYFEFESLSPVQQCPSWKQILPPRGLSTTIHGFSQESAEFRSPVSSRSWSFLSDANSKPFCPLRPMYKSRTPFNVSKCLP